MGQNCTAPPGVVQSQPLHQGNRPTRGARMVCGHWNKCHKAQLLMPGSFYSVGGVLKVSLQSLVILNLFTILIPYLYDVSGDEKQQTRRQNPGRERHTDEKWVLASWARVRRCEKYCIWWPQTIMNSPNRNLISLTGDIICKVQCQPKMPSLLFKSY